MGTRFAAFHPLFSVLYNLKNILDSKPQMQNTR